MTTVLSVTEDGSYLKTAINQLKRGFAERIAGKSTKIDPLNPVRRGDLDSFEQELPVALVAGFHRHGHTQEMKFHCQNFRCGADRRGEPHRDIIRPNFPKSTPGRGAGNCNQRAVTESQF